MFRLPNIQSEGALHTQESLKEGENSQIHTEFYSFPITAMTDHYDLGGLNSANLLSYTSLSQHQGVGRAVPSSRPPRSVSLPLPAPQAWFLDWRPCPSSEPITASSGSSLHITL